MQPDLSPAAALGAYRAPFAAGGPVAIDEALCSRLLSVALSKGGDYADLFFEYRAGGGLSFEEGILRSASRDVSLGLGVRVQKGDATGYAYVEDMEFDAMKRAAETAARIADGGKTIEPVRLERRDVADRYRLEQTTLEVPGAQKRDLLERASKAVLAFDSRIIKASASFSEEVREILIATSDGRFVRDFQPMLRFGISAVAQDGSKRESGRSGGGGRMTLSYFAGKSPEDHARIAAQQALVLLDARPAPAGQMEVVLAPGDSGILLHEAVGHGLEADFNRKKTSNYSDQINKPVASPLVTVVDDGTVANARGSINVDDEGNPGKRNVLIENGILVGYMQDKISSKHFKTTPSGNGRRQSFRHEPLPRMT
ncbi:MAG TPA: TldD/PmbA family protein, partial [Polyangiaceae bacterium]|nr:TldD/PmbA family protein [Polyangiaceae bacterium]